MGTRPTTRGSCAGGEAEADGSAKAAAVARVDRMKSFRRTWERGFGREHSAGVLTEQARAPYGAIDAAASRNPDLPPAPGSVVTVPSAAMIATAGWEVTPKAAQRPVGVDDLGHVAETVVVRNACMAAVSSARGRRSPERPREALRARPRCRGPPPDRWGTRAPRTTELFRMPVEAGAVERLAIDRRCRESQLLRGVGGIVGRGGGRGSFNDETAGSGEGPADAESHWAGPRTRRPRKRRPA